MADTIPEPLPSPRAPGNGQRATILFFWIQVALAAIFTGLNLWSLVTRPTLQIEFSRESGRVSGITEGGAGERAGLRLGDRIVSIAGHPISPGFVPLYDKAAGVPVEIVFVRDGLRRATNITPVSYEQSRREALQRDAGRALWAINGYLGFPLHLLMLSLGVALLVMRPENRDARLSALTLAAWAGGGFFYSATGIGVLFNQLPRGVVAAIHILDAYFIALFFAACLHFAIVFATKKPVRRVWHFVPYLATLPMFVEALAKGFHRFSGAVTLYPFLPWYDITGPLILIVALVILGVRFKRMEDANSRRRLQV
ncbi:MAG TPA: PDZ domain-containing protein, partial [Thermoanaerobaculia bacterium]|nr:PDZ domain-containing protein [Thermoanaerobaculia bacterium]